VYLEDSVPPALAEPETGPRAVDEIADVVSALAGSGPRAVSGSVTGGMTILSHQLADDFQDARNLIARLEEHMPPRLRGLLITARQLVTEAQDGFTATEEEASGR
jgi:hypothetical protein